MEPQPAIDQAAAELQEKLAPEAKTDLEKLLDRDIRQGPMPTAKDILGEWNNIATMAEAIVQGGFAPDALKSKGWQAVAVVIAKGMELGLPPMLSVQMLHVVNGKVGMAGELMIALFRTRVAGSQFRFLERTDTRAVVAGWRPGFEQWEKMTFTIEDAKAAGLVGKGVWTSYKADMLAWRAVSRWFRAYASDVILGCGYTPEEMDNIAPPAPVPEADPAAPALPTRREQQEGGKEAPAAAEAPKPAPKAPPVSAAIKEAQGALAARWRAMKEEVNPDYKWVGADFMEFCASITGRPMPPAAWTFDDVAAINADLDQNQNPMPKDQRGHDPATGTSPDGQSAE